MKINTVDLYKRMTSVEKANLYLITTNEVERGKIRASVPRLSYSALDYEFTNRVDRSNFEQLTLLIDWFRVVALLTEAYHDQLHVGGTDKRLGNLYLSKLAALDQVIDQNHKEILATMGQTLDVMGYEMVYELQVQA